MTTSEYDELVERLRKQAKQAHAMDVYLAQGEVGPGEQSKQMTKAADAITRLLREKSELANTAHLRFKEIVDLGVKVASARAQGAEEMREAAAKECEYVGLDELAGTIRALPRKADKC